MFCLDMFCQVYFVRVYFAWLGTGEKISSFVWFLHDGTSKCVCIGNAQSKFFQIKFDAREVCIIRPDLLLPMEWILDHRVGRSTVGIDTCENKICDFEFVYDFVLLTAMITILRISRRINRNEVQPLVLGLIWHKATAQHCLRWLYWVGFICQWGLWRSWQVHPHRRHIEQQWDVRDWWWHVWLLYGISALVAV